MKDPKRNQLKKRLGPGFWIDQNDNLHISLTELLEKFGLPETPENLAKMKETAKKILKEMRPDAKQVDRYTRED